MAESTGIAWTDHTFNIVWGCTKVSPGCQNCYADGLAHRWGFDVWGADKPRRVLSDANWRKPFKWNREAERAGKRARVFCGSMCDLFEADPTTREQLLRLWPVIRSTPWLDWQLLTKRPERIEQSLPDDWGGGWVNVWLGTSVENDKYLHRVDTLREIPAVCRFISYEPALGPIDSIDLTGIAWLIYGGESGPAFRQDKADWATAIRNRCEASGVAFFYKQAANRLPGRLTVLDGREYHEFPTRTRAGVSELSGGNGITEEWTESDVLEETEVKYKNGDDEMTEAKTEEVEGGPENCSCPDEASGLNLMVEDGPGSHAAEAPETAAARPAGESAENPSIFGFADHLSTLVEEIDIPEPGQIPEHERLREYSKIYEEVARFDSALRLFDVAAGEIAWIKGTILNLFKPITPGEKGILKRGEWKAFINRFNISDDTSENLRHIATYFGRAKARQFGYTKMVGIYWADRRLERDAVTTNEDQDQITGGDDDRPTTGSDGEPQQEDTTGDAPRTLRVSDVPKKLERIEQSLDFMAEQLADATDLFKNPEDGILRLKDLLATVNGLPVRVEQFKQAISTAIDKVQAFIDERAVLCRDSVQQKEVA